MTYDIWIKKNPYFTGAYKIYLRDRKGRSTLSYSKASQYRVKFQKDWLAPLFQPFPTRFKTAAQKKNYVSYVIGLYEKERIQKLVAKQSKSGARKILDLKAKITVLKTIKSKAAKQKSSKLKKQLEDETKKLRIARAQIRKPLSPQEKKGKSKSKAKKKAGPESRVSIKQKTVFSVSKKENLNLKAVEILHKPVPFTFYTIESVLSKKTADYIKKFTPHFKKLKKNQKTLLLRFLYLQKLSDGTQVIRGFGIPSRSIKSLKSLTFEMINLINSATDKFSGERGYFSKGYMPLEVDLIGATFEWVESRTVPLVNPELKIRQKEWAQEKRKYRAKAYRSRQRTMRG